MLSSLDPDHRLGRRQNGLAGACWKASKLHCLWGPEQQQQGVCDNTAPYMSAHYLYFNNNNKHKPHQKKQEEDKDDRRRDDDNDDLQSWTSPTSSSSSSTTTTTTTTTCGENTQNSLEYVVIGRCTAIFEGQPEWQQCSNLASRCQDPHRFVPYDPTCTIARDWLYKTLTYYGRCVDSDATAAAGATTATAGGTTRKYKFYRNSHCAWSPDDCGEEQLWIPNDTTCTSDQVQIGACYAGGQVFCSVSRDNCVEPREPYYNHFVIQDELNIDCVLFDPHVVTTTTKSAEGTARPPPELSPTNIHSINVSNSDRVSSPSSLSGTTGTTPTLLRTSPSPQPTEHAHSTGSRFGEIITLMFAAMGGLFMASACIFLFQTAWEDLLHPPSFSPPPPPRPSSQRALRLLRTMSLSSSSSANVDGGDDDNGAEAADTAVSSTRETMALTSLSTPS